MRKTVLDASFKADQWQPKYPFDLVVAYEDAATRERAMSLHDHLASRLNDDFDFQCTWWNFSHIADPTLREQAIDDATAANMIVLSLHPGSELPRAAQSWMEQWAQRSDHNKCALVTLFADTAAAKSVAPTFTRLKQIARQARMDFFSNLADASGALGELDVHQITERATTLTPSLKGTPDKLFPLPRWGINES